LVEPVTHHALLGVEVDYVELVDPRRDDDPRFGVNLVLCGRVMDHFDQAIPEDYSAGRRGQILADLEMVGVSHSNRAGSKVLKHDLQAVP